MVVCGYHFDLSASSIPLTGRNRVKRLFSLHPLCGGVDNSGANHDFLCQSCSRSMSVKALMVDRMEYKLMDSVIDQMIHNKRKDCVVAFINFFSTLSQT